MKKSQLTYALFWTLSTVSQYGFAYKIKPKINPKGPLVTHHAVSCLLSIVDSFFVESSLIVMTDSFNMTAPGADIERIFMEEIHALSRWSVMIVGNDKRTNTTTAVPSENTVSYLFADKADYYVIIVDSLSMFHKKITNLVRLDSWNPRANIVVLCSNHFTDEPSMKSYSQNILQHLWAKYILYAVVLLQDVKIRTTFQVFSWNPYDPPTRCGNGEEENATDSSRIYDTCVGGHLRRNEDLFRDKLPSNMRGCRMKVLAMIMPPLVNGIEDGNPGIEMELLRTISNKLNVEMIIDYNNTSRGDKGGDGNWTGMMKKLWDRKGDIALGGVYPDNTVHVNFEATTSYLQDSYTWVVPRALFLPRWLGLMIIFEKYLWLYVVVVYILCTLVWLVLGELSHESSMHRSLDHCAINTWIMNIGGVAYNRPVNQTLRVFFIFLCLYNVVLVTAYQTKLIMVLTQPSYEKQIDSLEEILKIGLGVGGVRELKDIIDESDEILYRKVSKIYRGVENIEETLHNVIVRRDFALLASRMFLNDISSKKIEFTDSFGNPNYHELSGNVLSIPVEIISRKGFPFVMVIGDLISLMKSNGLMSKWVRDYAIESTRKSAEVKRNATLETQDPNDNIRLSLEHLQGGFCILAVGHMVGMVVFLLEIVTNTTAYVHAKTKFNRKLFDEIARLRNKTLRKKEKQKS